MRIVRLVKRAVEQLGQREDAGLRRAEGLELRLAERVVVAVVRRLGEEDAQSAVEVALGEEPGRAEPRGVELGELVVVRRDGRSAVLVERRELAVVLNL